MPNAGSAVAGDVLLPVQLVSSSLPAWDYQMVLRVADRLLAAAAGPADRAHQLSSCAQESGDWLNALPLANIGLRLDNGAVSIAVSLRLGLPAVHAHPCACGAAVVATGHHSLSCARSAGRQGRHASANNIIHHSLHSAGIPALREPTGLLTSSSLCPNGFSTLLWRRGEILCVGFHLPRHPIAASHIQDTGT